MITFARLSAEPAKTETGQTGADSFLKTGTWQNVRKKIERSKKSWGEIKEEQ